MALISGIAYEDIRQRGMATDRAGEGESSRGYLLSDEEYERVYGLPGAEERMARVETVPQQMIRGGEARSRAMLEASGLGGTVAASRAAGALGVAGERAVRRARLIAQMEEERRRRQRFAERDRQRAEEMQMLGMVGSLEAAGLSAIPYVGPALAAGTGFANLAMQQSLMPGEGGELPSYGSEEPAGGVLWG